MTARDARSGTSGEAATRVLMWLAVALLLVLASWWWQVDHCAAPEQPASVLGRGVATAGADVAPHDAAPAFMAPGVPAKPTALTAGEEPSFSQVAVPAVSADGTPLTPLEVTLKHADGMPASGVTLLLCEGREILQRALTDAAGHAAFAPLAGGSAPDRAAAQRGAPTLVVGGASDVPLALPLASASGAQELTLPEGLVISGLVLVDGARPSQPLLLGLHALPAPRKPSLPIDVGTSLYVALPGVGQEPMENALVVGTDGAFRFSALPAAWEGAFDIGYQYAPGGVDEHGSTLDVRAPAGNVLLELRSCFSVHGRVVDVGGGVPVPGAIIDAGIFLSDGSRSQAVEADDDGRFLILGAWYETRFERLELSIHHPEGRGACDVAFATHELTRGADLGDIELLATRDVPFEVRDPQGRPVQGAFAVADDASSTRSRTTREDGRATLGGVLFTTPSMTVWAHRFTERLVALPPDLGPVDDEHPLVVELAPCPSLDLHVTGMGDTIFPQLHVVLSCDRKLFSSTSADSGEPDSFTPSGMAYLAGMTPSEASNSSSTLDAAGRRVVSGSVALSVPRDGRVSVSNLLPDVSFELSLQGDSGGLAWGPETVSLRADEARVLHVELPHPALPFVLRVVDPQAQPVPAANVRLDWARKPSGGTVSSTDDDGRLTLKQVYGETLDFVVSKRGFATARLSAVPVNRGGAPLEVVLQPGRTVRVVVRDTDGRDVTAESVGATLGGERVGRAEQVAPAAIAAATAEAGVGAASGFVAMSGTESAPAAAAPGNASAPGSAVLASAPGTATDWEISDLPAVPVTLEAFVGGRRFERVHDTAVPEATIVVPAAGALRVRFGFALDPEATYRLDVRALDAGSSAEAFQSWIRRADVAAAQRLLPSLVAGTYDLTLHQLVEGPVQPASRTARVSVVPGETTECTLSMP